jgi:cytochrome c oxidase subunit 2
MRSSALLRAVVVFLLLGITSSAWAVGWDMTPGVTDYSYQVYNLHRTILGICVVIAVIVFAVMFYAVIFHRKSRGAEAADFHESTTVEIIWTIIPFLILIVMAIPATRVLIIKYDSGNADLTVRITGSQWKWNYEYLSYGDNKDIGLSYYSVLSTPREQFERQKTASVMDSIQGRNVPDFGKDPNYLMEVDKPLVIPSGKKVRFLITADDVIHAWWVPDFAVKQDAVPGFINDAWVIVPPGKEGTYIGRCAELCGKDHAFMPIVVIVKNQADFTAWLADTKKQADIDAKAAANSVNYKFANLAEAMTFGQTVFEARCAACHQIGGTGLPPMFPALKGSKIAADKARKADHIHLVQNGKNAMPAWKGILSPKEMAGVITYERNAWGNNTGDLVQPSDVATK